MKRLRILLEAVHGRLRQMRALVRKRATEQEMADELAHHLELETEQNIRRGMDPSAAHRAAIAAFGGVERYAEQVREVRWTRWLEDVGHDVRYAGRALGRARAFTAAVALTLALGIGANAALFGMVNAVVFRMPGGVPDSDRLVWVRNDGRLTAFSHPDFRDLQKAGGGVVQVAGYQSMAVALSARGEAVRVPAQLVSGNYFDVLGVQPVRGRSFTMSEDAVPARDAVAVVSHSLWQTRFGGDDDVIGSAVLVNGHPFRVVGVAPPQFRGLSIEDDADIWVPFMTQPWTMPRSFEVLGNPAFPQVEAVGRLEPGATPERAQAVLRLAAGQLTEAERLDAVQPAVQRLYGLIPVGALLSLGALIGFAGVLTLLVLLICCANVANLQLARSLGRGREIAVRLALGAGRGRIVRLLITESLLLALAAGAAGVLLSYWLAQWLQVRVGGPLGALNVSPDGSTLVFTFALALAAGLTFGLLPALRTTRPGLMTAIRGDEPGAPGGSRMRAMLVSAQVALSLVLLMAGGLFAVRLNQIRQVDPGFDAERLVAFSVDLHVLGYEDETERELFFDELRRRLATVPGVAAVAAPTYVPFGGTAVLQRVSLLDGASAADGSVGSSGAVVLGVPADFFTTLGVPAVRGRLMADEDVRSEVAGVVISEPLARRLWGGHSPIARTVQVGDTIVRIVGTVAELPTTQLASPNPMQVYLPENRHFEFADQHVLIRTAGTADAAVIAGSIIPRIRAEVRRLDDALPLSDVRVLGREVERQLGTQRMLTGLVGAFGLLALVLAGIGLYGVIASAVATRTREIGVRIALGARGRDVTGLFVGRGVRVAAYGVVAGALLAAGAGRLISTIVWGVRPFDAGVLLASAATLVVTAALASWLPARRAARVDPMRTLRED